MKTLKEEWKPINGYEGLYEISNYGIVKSLAKEWATGNGVMFKKETTILKPKEHAGGYRLYTLCKNGTLNNHSAHTLVYDHFGVGKRNGRKLQVDHIDEDKTNNRIDNLQLLTPRENISKMMATTDKPSKYPGVHWHGRDKKWGTQIRHNRQRTYLGLFETEKEAYAEYERALKEFEETGMVTSSVKKRICTNKYKGVKKNTGSKNYQARITVDGKRIHLGTFPTEYDAHIAYEKAFSGGVAI